MQIEPCKWATSSCRSVRRILRSGICILLFILPSLVVLCFSSGAPAEDVIRVKSPVDDRAITIHGRIADYTGQVITIDRVRGGPRRYPADRVLEIQTTWSEPHQAGRDALAKHDYRAAVELLNAANRSEERVWVRRLILAELMRCYEALGQPQQAALLFLSLIQSDPTAPAYGGAPLAWFGDDRITRAQAEAWLGTKDQPATVLLGASYLLTTTGGDAAQQPLSALMKHDDPRIAALAEAQLWRVETLRAEPADVARWARRVEQMPAEVRAGPYFILGQTYERLGMVDEAILAYLRVPVLFDARPELAARALVAAGRLAKRTGHPDEARQILEEVLREHPNTPQVNEAEQLLGE